MRDFLQRYTNKSVPDESTLRKNYVETLYKETLNEIRSAVGDNNIWFSVDETTDSKGQAVANFIVGILSLESENKSFLLNSEVLERTNSETVATFVVDSLNILWNQSLHYDRVLLVVTDAAAYMVKAIKGLQILFPKVIHLTCLAHGLHRVAETVRGNFPSVDKLVGVVKRIYKKSPRRIRAFKEKFPSTPLPPSPVQTRWGTWLTAVTYFANYFGEIKACISELPDDDSASIPTAKALLEEDSITAELAFISDNYASLVSSIHKLEHSSLPLCESLSVVKEAVAKVTQVPGERGKALANKMNSVLSKNTGFQKINAIASILSGEVSNVDINLTPSQINSFKCAPVTSTDVERSFSIYKHILDDRRCRLTQQHMKWMLVIYCASSGK